MQQPEIADLIQTIAANHGLPDPVMAKTAPAKSIKREKLRDDEEDDANAAQDGAQAAAAEATGGDAPLQLALNETGVIASDAPLQLAAAETAAAGAGEAAGGAGAGAGAGATAAAGGIGLGGLALGGLAVAGIAAAAGGGGGGSVAAADTTAPTATLTAEAIANNGSATVQSSETGTAYLVKNTLAVTTLADITGAADAQWNSVSIATANSATSLSVAGLDAGVYKLYTADAAGNLSAVASDTAVVTNTATTTMDISDGTVVADGADLIAPVYVDGNWYYYWDRSGDGSSADSGGLNGGLDSATHDVLDGIFANDINGVANTAVTNWDGNYGTTDTYRYATLNSVKVALPTPGDASLAQGTRPGTAIDNNPAGEANPTYDDLLAIWDGYNGAGVGDTNIDGTPPGWQAVDYWTATHMTLGHALVYLNSSYHGSTFDTVNHCVALQVL